MQYIAVFLMNVSGGDGDSGSGHACLYYRNDNDRSCEQDYKEALER